MTEANSRPRRPPAVVLALAAIVAIAATWWMLRTNTPPAVRECLRLYAEARTAADSLVVDSTVTEAAARLTNPRQCGSMRTSSRWQ